MTTGIKKVIVLLVPCALSLVSGYGYEAKAQAQAQVSSPEKQLLERVYQARDYYALSELAREQALQNPKSIYAHYYLAVALQELGQKAEARNEYLKVVQLDKNGPYGARATMAYRAISAGAASTASTTTGSAASTVKSGNTATARTEAATRPAQQTQPVSASVTSHGAVDNTGVEKQRSQLIKAAEHEKAAASAKFNTDVDRINRLDSGTTVEKDARIQEALKQLMKYHSDIDARLAKQLTELNNGGIARGGGGTSVSTSAGGLVHSYEHLDTNADSVILPSENPMSATAVKMQIGTPKKTGAKSK